MSQDEFEKLYFKAKLAGAKAVGELMIKLIRAGEEKFAFKLVREYSPGAIKPPAVENVSLDRPCNWSPYGYCFTNTLGQNLEYKHPDSIYCIWCEKIYSADQTDPELNYIEDGKIISGDSMLIGINSFGVPLPNKARDERVRHVIDQGLRNNNEN